MEEIPADADVCFNAISKRLQAKNKDTFLQQIHDLHAGYSELVQFAPEYDFTVPANGFRSFAKIILIYLHNVSHLLQGENETRNQTRQLQDYERVASSFLRQLRILRAVRARDLLLGSDRDLTAFTSHDQEILRQVLSFSEDEIRAFHSEISNFWIRDFSRRFLQSLTWKLLLISLPPNQLLRMVFNPDVKLNFSTQRALFCSVSDIRKAIALLESKPVRAVQAIRFRGMGSAEILEVPRQSHWLLATGEDGHVAVNKVTEREKEKPVQCLFIRNATKGISPHHSLIIHAHGGGFVATSPRAHEGYLRYWCTKLGVPVICPNYRKAPEHPYPAGLQDLLDVYLLLTSGSDQVVDLIGFHPKRIILTGDSAGGNLSPALTFVLNDIRRMGAESPVMPVALAVQYPAPDPTLIFDASKTMVTFDPLLSTSKMLTFLSAYHGIPVTPEDPWFRKKVLLSEVSNQLATKARDPYYNLLAYKHLKDLRHLPLFVTACEFDALLDGAIAFAKVWQGPVTLDIAMGLPHGFLIGAGRKEVQFEIDRCTKRISEGLGLCGDPDADCVVCCDEESIPRPAAPKSSLFSKISAAKIHQLF